MLAGRPRNPDSSMNLVIVSDLHLSPHTAPRSEAFLELLRLAHAAHDEVLIVGDLFDLWFGFESLTYDYQKPILAEMKRLASEGLAMDYVEGNRDFHIRAYRGSIFRSVSEEGF